MTELEQFRATFSNKSKITQGVYNSNYKKLKDLIGNDVVNDEITQNVVDKIRLK